MKAYNELVLAVHIDNKAILCTGELLELASITLGVTIISALQSASARPCLNDKAALIEPDDAESLRLMGKALSWLAMPSGGRAKIKLYDNSQKAYHKCVELDFSSMVVWDYKDCILQSSAPFTSDLNRCNELIEFPALLAFFENSDSKEVGDCYT
jgi:hypothetical protein